MSMRCQDLVTALEQWAPPAWAEDWDNPGLTVGARDAVLTRVMVALTPDEATAQAAAEAGAQLLLTHHPLIFKPIKQLNSDTAVGRTVLTLAAHGVAHYCAHTNLDIAPGGVNDVLAAALGLTAVEPLADLRQAEYCKVVVYVPAGYEDRVRDAMCGAGAGCVGAYSRCTFQARGTGTFLPGAGTSPFLGEAGRLEYADEYRLETIVPRDALPAVLAAMRAAHPYEEAACDVFRLDPAGCAWSGAVRGIGRIGDLPRPLPLEAFLELVGERLGCAHLAYHAATDAPRLRRVALCGGSGASYLQEAKRAGADVYLTGDVKYHDAQTARQLGLTLVDAGHFATERCVVRALADFVRRLGLEAIVYAEEDYLSHWHRAEPARTAP